MTDIHVALQAFIQGQLDFNGLLDAVGQAAAQDPAQLPELIDQINTLYREGRLPPQIYGALLTRAGQSNGTAGQSQPADSTAATEDDPAPADHTRIAKPPGEGSAADSTRIATPPPTQAEPEHADATRIASERPVSIDKAEEGHTRIASGQPTGPSAATTGQTTPTAGSQPSSSGSWNQTTGTRTASRKISHEPAVGDVMKDRFVLEAAIGRGGMGIVFKALDKRKVEASDRHPYVALKLLNESFKQHPESLMALQREARKAQDLKHPNVIGIFDFDKDEFDNYFIAMELLDGYPLDKTIKSMRGTGMPVNEALSLVSQMGQALAAAHNHKPSIIHSDFKPGNVFLTRDKGVKVFDFGIARAAKPKDDAGKGDVTAFDAKTLGALTPTYASLEMLEGLDPDPRDDIYALAIVAYELLTGTRPFGRTPANQAMAEGLTANKIEGLSRRQWKGLQRGLAFRREQRSPSVEVFLDELRFRKSKAPLIIALSGAGLGLMSWLLIPPYLEKRREEELITAIEQAAPTQIPGLVQQGLELPDASRSVIDNKVIERLARIIEEGEAGQIHNALAAVETLPAGLKKEIVSSAKEAILAFYIEQADGAFSPQAARYDFTTAEQLLSQVRALYPDSIQVFRTAQRMEDSRNDLLNDLDSRFNRHLVEGRLLPLAETDDMTDVLAVLKKIDPKHPLLTDARLANAYASQAASSLEDKAFDQAQDYVTEGTLRFTQDPVLNNLQVKIRIAQQQQAARARLDQLRERVQQQLPALNTLEDYLGFAEPLTSLQAMQPDDPSLTQADKRLRQLIDKQITNLLKDNAWQQGEELLEDFAPLLRADYLLSQQLRLGSARDTYEKRLAKLFSSLKEAVGQKRLTRPAGNSAMDLLARARELAPDDRRIDQSIASISQAYLDLSRKARAGGEWQQARDYVHKGQALKSLDSVSDSLQAELAEITKAEEQSLMRLASAEREKLDRQRQAAIQGLYDEFQDQLAKMDLTLQGGKALLGILDRLAALNPTDPLLEQGRVRIADRFDGEGQRLSQQGEWNQAIALLRKGIDVIPESALLSQRLAQLQQGYATALSAEQDRQVRDQKAQIDNLIAKPQFTQDWGDKLLASINSLDGLLPAGDSWLEKTTERVAQLYLQQAAVQRTRQQFAEAGALLQSGRRFAPQLSANFAQEQAALDADEAAWENANREKVRLARLEGTKQSMLTQAKANDIATALKTLSSLRQELSADDVFLQVTGPQAIGSAYLRLAERRANRKDFDAAIKLLGNGLEIAPDMPELQDALSLYREESAIQQVRSAVSKTPATQLSGLQQSLADLQKRFPKRYPALSEEFAAILAKRVESTRKPKAAETLLESARALFPASKRLAKISIEQPIQPAVIATQGLKAVEAGDLSKAQQLLKEARRKEQGHPDLERLRQALEAKVKRAEALFSKHAKALKRNDRKQAKADVAQALKVWRDNPLYRNKLLELEKTPAKTKTVAKEPCNSKFAGYGKRSSKFRCYDLLGDKQKGPIMVVVPAGGGNSTPYAIGRYEISIGDYNTYCRLSGNCKAISGKNSKLPLSNVSFAEAEKYTRWLSQKTGFTYRLPTEQEWRHAAQAKGKQPPGSDFNCLLRSRGAVVKGGGPVHVNVAPQNAWGLFNYVGNVQEWVVSGSGQGVRGGHYNDPAGNCSIDLSRQQSGAADKVTGLRLLREIKG